RACRNAVWSRRAAGRRQHNRDPRPEGLIPGHARRRLAFGFELLAREADHRFDQFMALFAFGFERLFEFGNAMLISLDALLDWRVDVAKHLLQPREFELGKLLRRAQFV